MYNGNNLVIPASNNIELGNGIKVSEQRGKKDMMWGTVLEGNFKHKEILYPVYAADDMCINGRTCHIVNDKDIVMSKGDNNESIRKRNDETGHENPAEEQPE